MNCIYCNQLTSCTYECSNCLTSYLVMGDEFYGVTIHYQQHDKYTFFLNVAENYTTFCKNNKYVKSFPGLYWIFPQNIQTYINKFNNLLAFI